MADLVTLTQVKNHLRITGTDEDTDLALKISQASERILEHLGDRGNVVATIESSSVANPTVITTEEAHGFANGDTVNIAGHEDSTPAVFGDYTVSNVTEFTFTVPVKVTVAGTGGTATVEWTTTTAPAVVQGATLRLVANLYGFRGDDLDVPEGRNGHDLPPSVTSMLVARRDPA